MPHNNREKRLAGGGPWKFEVPALGPGESWVADFRNREYNGSRGYFRQWLPFDYAQVTNQNTSINLAVEINGVFEDTVVPNAIEDYSNQNITEIRITNQSGTDSTSAGDVAVAVGVEPYDSDDRAREQKTQPTLAGVVEKFTGVNPSW